MRRCFLPLALLAFAGACGAAGGDDPAGHPIAPSETEPRTTIALLPTGLTMPVRVDDINLRGIINPFGVD